MTIEQERDIAVRALEDIRRGAMAPKGIAVMALGEIAAIKREQALQALTDQAQELDMGYGAAQASPVAQDERSRPTIYESASKEPLHIIEANECNGSLSLTTIRFQAAFTEIHRLQSLLASQPAAQPVGEAVAWKYRTIGALNEWRVTLREDWARVINSQTDVIPLYAAPVAQDQDAVRRQFMSEREAWIVWTNDGESCRVFVRDENGDRAPILGWNTPFFHTHTEAIDAAMQAEVK